MESHCVSFVDQFDYTSACYEVGCRNCSEKKSRQQHLKWAEINSNLREIVFRIELEAFEPHFSCLQGCVLLCHPYHASQALSKCRRCSQNHSCDEELCAHEHEEQFGPLQPRFEPKSSTSLSLGIIRELSMNQLRFADSWPRHVISPFLCEEFAK